MRRPGAVRVGLIGVLSASLALGASTPAFADGTVQPSLVPVTPAYMPASPPPLGAQELQQAKVLRHQAALFTGLGIGLFAAGIAVNVVALDVPQSQQVTREGDNLVTRNVLGPANWVELAAGIALMGTGLALGWLGIYRRNQARRIEGNGP